MVLKELERKMLSELLKNSRRSDRELAKAIGASQPTATRIRTKLEKDGFIKEYTAIPGFNKIGYSILAISFIKFHVKHSLPVPDLGEFRKTHYDVLAKNSSTVMFANRGMGMGFDAVVVSLHEDYASCKDFQTFIRQSMTDSIVDLNTFLINIAEEQNSLPFSFNSLASQILASAGDNKDQKTQVEKA
jgi:DNA-binding Lrp family transcriptional regulator